MKKFNVIVEDINRKEFIPYDVIPYLVDCYKKIKNKDEIPVSVSDFREFVKRKSMYQWWCRCEYEVLLDSWPNKDIEKKIDVHWQIMMNLDIITDIVMDECRGQGKRK